MRSDITVLRALAVLLVVIFHFNNEWVPGGFIGVDVFFVISGFLMTKIIYTDVSGGQFSYVTFLARRVQRLLPALLVLLAALFVVGWFASLNIPYYSFANHVLSTLLFLSNFLYWRESGYFSADSHENWLLHTWSLSVEWQFYLFYPLLLIFLFRFLAPSIFKPLLLVITFVSFLFSVIAAEYYINAAYYLLPTRVWEMLIGGVVYFYPVTARWAKNNSIHLQLLSFVLIFISAFVVSPGEAWPSYVTLVPILSACLILGLNSSNSIFYKEPVFRQIGLWSYSIYLWHWPVVIIIYNYLANSFFQQVVGIITSIALGAVSYRFIEKKINIKTIVCGWGGLVCLALLVMFFKGDIPTRNLSQSVKNELLEKYAGYQLDPTGLYHACNTKLNIERHGFIGVQPKCVSDELGGVLMWGDSHVAAISTGVRRVLPANTPFSLLTSSGCSPALNYKRKNQSAAEVGCEYSNHKVEAAIKAARPKLVIIGTVNNHQSLDWLQMVTYIKSLGVKRVWVVGPVPQWYPSLPLVYVKRHYGEEYITDDGFDSSLIQSNNYLKKLANENSQLEFFDVLSELCPNLNGGEVQCKALVGESSLIVFDYGHFTLEGSEYIAQRIFKKPLSELFNFAE